MRSGQVSTRLTACEEYSRVVKYCLHSIYIECAALAHLIKLLINIYLLTYLHTAR